MCPCSSLPGFLCGLNLLFGSEFALRVFLEVFQDSYLLIAKFYESNTFVNGESVVSEVKQGQIIHLAGACYSFFSLNDLEYFYSPVDGTMICCVFLHSQHLT